MKSGQTLLCALLFLVCAFSCQIQNWLVFGEPLEDSQSLSVLVPERLRGFVAARLWEQADRYMHAGPSSRVPENFVAGSYAGNTDLLPILQLVTELVPEELSPWMLLAENLGRHVGKKDEAVRLLQNAIRLNRKNPDVHQLYASIGRLKIFAGKPERKDKDSALKYMQTAISLYEKVPGPRHEDLTGFSLQAYHVLASRLCVELGRPKHALDLWLQSGLPLEADQGKLAEMLLQFRDKGIEPDVKKFTEELPSVSELEKTAKEPQETPDTHGHNHLSTRRSRMTVVCAIILFLMPLLAGFYKKS
jgi:hypothetical protein